MDYDLEVLRAMLADRRIGMVADASGVSRPTIYRILNDRDYNPTIETVQKLAAYFSATGA
jgi:DNA-binding XRE family transcriptional regulator